MTRTTAKAFQQCGRVEDDEVEKGHLRMQLQFAGASNGDERSILQLQGAYASAEMLESMPAMIP